MFENKLAYQIAFEFILFIHKHINIYYVPINAKC